MSSWLTLVLADFAPTAFLSKCDEFWVSRHYANTPLSNLWSSKPVKSLVSRGHCTVLSELSF
jgi:hypothetical protein